MLCPKADISRRPLHSILQCPKSTSRLDGIGSDVSALSVAISSKIGYFTYTMPSLYIPVKRRCKSGPKTYLGKRRSSANSLKHGLYARKPHLVRRLKHAAVQEYDRLRKDFRPRSRAELGLLRGLAESTTRALWLDSWLDKEMKDRSENGLQNTRRMRRIGRGLRYAMARQRSEQHFLARTVEIFVDRLTPRSLSFRAGKCTTSSIGDIHSPGIVQPRP